MDRQEKIARRTSGVRHAEGRPPGRAEENGHGAVAATMPVGADPDRRRAGPPPAGQS